MAQFIAANGFSFGLPFAPFFMQKDLQVPSSSLPVYVALFGASAPLTMMLFAPIWGALADKFGRRKMLLRSYIGGAVAIGLMGPYFRVVLRIIRGAGSTCDSTFFPSINFKIISPAHLPISSLGWAMVEKG